MSDVESTEAGSSDPESDDETAPPAPAPDSKWLRVRKSSVLRADKIAQISIKRRDENYYLEIRADRDLYLPIRSLDDGVRALRAVEAGATDISEWTIPRSFMKDSP